MNKYDYAWVAVRKDCHKHLNIEAAKAGLTIVDFLDWKIMGKKPKKVRKIKKVI